jgi:hypothetical protein
VLDALGAVGVVHVHLHLPEVLVRELAELEIDPMPCAIMSNEMWIVAE